MLRDGSRLRSILVLVAVLTVQQSWAEEKALLEKGALRLHYLKLPVGYERYELTRDGRSLFLTSDFDFTDRGGRVRLDSSLQLGEDLTPQRFRAQGKTYRFVRVDDDVQVAGRRATVREGGRSSGVDLPDRFFTASGYAPFAVQMLLLRYWKEHGRPRSISIVPGSPLTEIGIEYRGYDTVTLPSGPVRLERFGISGLAWG